MPEAIRPLRIFLCYSSNDKLIVRDLYRRLETEGWIDAWLDSEKLYPGQDWNFEIEKAVESADVILVCLTKNSVNKEGYVQRELRIVLDLADYKPEGTLFVIPIRLEECEPPRRLRTWQYADYFPESDRDHAYQRLLVSLKMRARKLELSTENPVEVTKRLEAEERVRLANEQAEQEQKAIEVRARVANEKEEKEKKAREKKSVETRAPRAEPIAKQIEIEKLVEQPAARKQQKDAEEKPKSFWTTLPGILTGIAAVLTAVAGCVTAIISLWNAFPTAPTPTATIALVTQTPPVINTLAPTATLEVLGIGSTMISPKDGMTLVYVPEGEFIMGSDNGDANEKPAHKIYLDAFWIDQTEMTNAMYASCVADGGCTPPSSLKSYTHDTYYGNSKYDNYPIIYVNWDQAKTYCAWAGRRLPTEAQWEKAARGLNGNIYPWGNDMPKNNLLNYNRAVGDTTEVGKYPNGKSIYGALDMAGNVWEWVNDWYDSSYYSNSPSTNPQGPDSGQYQVLRGGSWLRDDNFVRSANRVGLAPTDIDSGIGFRCSRSP